MIPAYGGANQRLWKNLILKNRFF